jgi:hypothetical protein
LGEAVGTQTCTSSSSPFRLTNKLEAASANARKLIARCQGIEAIWRQNCHALPTETEPFGFRDGISHPAIEGSGIPGTNPKEQPLKAGEFVLGYPDEMGGVQKTRPKYWAATERTLSFASFISAWPTSAAF